jgi:uncharacterized membrane protein YtjA (UPF0391 family)
MNFVSNWVMGVITAVMGLSGLFVAANAGHGIAYQGGLLFFVFAMLFVFHLIRVSYDHASD